MVTFDEAPGFMFLGGPIDHGRRQVRVDRGGPIALPEAEYKVETKNEGTHLYRRYRVDVGVWTWYCFVLDGFSPSTSALLDTCPHFRH